MVSDSKILTTLVKLKVNGLSEFSIKGISNKLIHLARYADLDDPESVKRHIAFKKAKASYKDSLVKAYDYYVKLNSLSWIRPRYNAKKGLPRPPTTEQVKQLIASATRKYAPIFRFMSETGPSPIEVSIMTEKNFDFERNTVFIEGRKGHLDRYVPMSQELSALMKTFFSKHKRFPGLLRLERKYRDIRNELAEKTRDDRIRDVRLYDLRHYFGTMTYNKTKDILYVKDLMGHSKIETTLIYTKLVNFKTDEWVSKVAKTIEEACSLVEAGFEYVTEMEGVKIFRKRK